VNANEWGEAGDGLLQYEEHLRERMIDLKKDRRESQTKLSTHIGRRNKTI